MTLLKFATVLGPVLLLTALPTAAQVQSAPPLTEVEGRLVLDTLGHELVMPAPNWLEPNGSVLDRFDATFISDEGQSLLEIYPRGETKALWTTLYGARISRDEKERSLADYRAALMVLHANSCKPELTGFFQLGPDTDENNLAALGFVCGSYGDQYRNFAGLGEVMVASFRRSDTGVAIIFQEWRGKAFDPRDPSTWPVATSTVEARAAELQSQVSLSKAD